MTVDEVTLNSNTPCIKIWQSKSYFDLESLYDYGITIYPSVNINPVTSASHDLNGCLNKTMLGTTHTPEWDKIKKKYTEELVTIKVLHIRKYNNQMYLMILKYIKMM